MSAYRPPLTWGPSHRTIPKVSKLTSLPLPSCRHEREAEGAAPIPGRPVPSPGSHNGRPSCAGRLRQGKRTGVQNLLVAGKIRWWGSKCARWRAGGRVSPRRRHAGRWTGSGQCSGRLDQPDRPQCGTVSGGALGVRSVGHTEDCTGPTAACTNGYLSQAHADAPGIQQPHADAPGTSRQC